MIALVPARKGSKRLPNKNIRPLGGKPLILWMLQAAYNSGVFSEVYISTDSAEIAEVAVSHTGCKHIQRPPHLATDDSPDIEWVRHALGTIEHLHHKAHSICAPCSLGHSYWTGAEMAILRPTSPFLAPETIQRAKALWDDIKGSQADPYCACPWELGGSIKMEAGGVWCQRCGLPIPQKAYDSKTQKVVPRGVQGFDSLRAIRRASEPAWKQWRYAEDSHEIDPITTVAARKHLHSRPTQTLEDCWIQTAGLEMCWTRTPLELGTIAGNRVAGFPLEGPEALDLNTPEDWDQAEALLALK